MPPRREGEARAGVVAACPLGWGVEVMVEDGVSLSAAFFRWLGLGRGKHRALMLSERRCAAKV